MKKLIAFTSGLLACASMAYSAPNSVVFNDTSVATNSATSGITTNTSVFIDGWVDCVIIDVGGTSTNVDVDVTTVASMGTGPSRTILSTNDITGDLVLFPRLEAAHGTDGGATEAENVRIPLSMDKLQVWVQAETTGVTAKVWVLISPLP